MNCPIRAKFTHLERCYVPAAIKISAGVESKLLVHNGSTAYFLEGLGDDVQSLDATLLQPSLVALWLSQLIVFAVYPLFVARRRQRLWPACALSLGAGAFALYGLWTALEQASS